MSSAFKLKVDTQKLEAQGLIKFPAPQPVKKEAKKRKYNRSAMANMRGRDKKFNQQTRLQIYWLHNYYDMPYSITELSKIFKCNRTTIHKIVNAHHNYRHMLNLTDFVKMKQELELIENYPMDIEEGLVK